MSKAPSFKPEGLSSLPVSPGPELVTVVRGLRNETLDAHTEPEARTRTKSQTPRARLVYLYSSSNHLILNPQAVVVKPSYTTAHDHGLKHS